jgi:hypothetical protein
MDMQYSVVEQKINKFIEKYGIGELIRYLEKYDTIVNKSDYEIWLTLKENTAEEINIPKAEMDGIYTKTTNVDARRIAVYIATNVIKINRPALASFLNVSVRTICNYISYTVFMLEKKNVRPDFYEHYDNVYKKFNEWLNNRKI